MKYIAILFFIILGACAHNTKNQQSKFHLFVFDCGENKVKDISLFSPGVDKGQSKTLVARCYLIRHPRGSLMWDTGLNDSLVSKKDGLQVRGGAFTLRVNKTLISQLKRLGVEPQDIEYLAFSHMHPDHSGNANLFTKSKVLIQKEEYQAAFGKTPEMYSFNKALYAKLPAENIVEIDGDHDVFGDGSVVILKTPGHTPGHQSLFIDLPETGPIVLSGDLYHFAKNRKFKRVPSFNYDKELTLKSMN